MGLKKSNLNNKMNCLDYQPANETIDQLPNEPVNEQPSNKGKITKKLTKMFKDDFTTPTLHSTHLLVLDKILKFFNEPVNKNILVSIINQETSISLRLLDWLVTNYSKKYNICYKLESKVNKNFFLWLDYKNQLNSYSKRLLDPFCRGQRIL